MARYGKNSWALGLLILAGIVAGGFIGYLCKDVPYLSVLNYSKEFTIAGSNNGTLQIDLGILVLDFALTIKISIASILGIIISVLIYRRL